MNFSNLSILDIEEITASKQVAVLIALTMLSVACGGALGSYVSHTAPNRANMPHMAAGCITSKHATVCLKPGSRMLIAQTAQ